MNIVQIYAKRYNEYFKIGKLVTREGFPTPQGALEQLADFINGGPIIGTAIEAVKSVVNVIIGQIVKVLVTPILSTDLYSQNPTILTPLNDTTTIQLQSELSIQGSNSIQGLSNNIDNLVDNPYLPSLQLPIPLDGALGDLLKMSGPVILVELFKQLADIIVSQVFIGIIGIDKIVVTQQNLIDLIQTFTGYSISELESLFNIDINQAINDPTMIGSLVSNLFSRINPSAFDYTNPSSTVNTIGFGKPLKAVLNVGESLNHGLIIFLHLTDPENFYAFT